jgi:hypothetical protein
MLANDGDGEQFARGAHLGSVVALSASVLPALQHHHWQQQHRFAGGHTRAGGEKVKEATQSSPLFQPVAAFCGGAYLLALDQLSSSSTWRLALPKLYSQRLVDAVIAVLVVPHGLTDAWSLPMIPMGTAYALSCSFGMVCPERYLPFVGGVASVVHFAGDLGYPISIALVVGLVALHERDCDKAAYVILLAYMVSVHLPGHYSRVASSTPTPGWIALLMFACVSWAMEPLCLLRDSVLYRRLGVALVVAHTVANMYCNGHP